MIVVSIMNQKGGVGKSFLAAELYYELTNRGYSVGYIDKDAQGKIIHNPKEYEATDDFVIIDTPGHLDEEFIDTVNDSDVIILPTIADDEGQKEPLLQSYLYALKNKNAKIGIVVSAFDGTQTMSKRYLNELGEANLPLWGTIRVCADFKKAHADGMSLRDFEPKKKAAIEDVNRIVERLEQECGFEKREPAESKKGIERKENIARTRRNFTEMVKARFAGR